jgi:hypothetical protein
MAPVRVQRKRTKGWKMPENTVSVTRPGIFGNHAACVCCEHDPARAVELFREWVEQVASPSWKAKVRSELRGKNLACWCQLDQPCHADVLLELANSPPEGKI